MNETVFEDSLRNYRRFLCICQFLSLEWSKTESEAPSHNINSNNNNNRNVSIRSKMITASSLGGARWTVSTCIVDVCVPDSIQHPVREIVFMPSITVMNGGIKSLGTRQLAGPSFKCKYVYKNIHHNVQIWSGVGVPYSKIFIAIFSAFLPF